MAVGYGRPAAAPCIWRAVLPNAGPAAAHCGGPAAPPSGGGEMAASLYGGGPSLVPYGGPGGVQYSGPSVSRYRGHGPGVAACGAQLVRNADAPQSVGGGPRTVALGADAGGMPAGRGLSHRDFRAGQPVRRAAVPPRITHFADFISLRSGGGAALVGEAHGGAGGGVVARVGAGGGGARRRLPGRAGGRRLPPPLRPPPGLAECLSRLAQL